MQSSAPCAGPPGPRNRPCPDAQRQLVPVPGNAERATPVNMDGTGPATGDRANDERMSDPRSDAPRNTDAAIRALSARTVPGK